MTGRPTKLTKALQKKIVAALKTGASIADVCQHVGLHKSTYYDWLQRGSDGEPEFSDFSDATTRAQADAKTTAIKTLKIAMQPYDETSVSVEIYTETRLTPGGFPYDYSRRTERKTVTSYKGDWRAAVEYLKRRHFAEWGDQSRRVNLNVEPEQLDRLMAALEARGLTPSEAFEALIAELASVDSNPGGEGRSG